MLDMASDKKSTVLFPLPIDLLAGLRDGRLGELLTGNSRNREQIAQQDAEPRG